MNSTYIHTETCIYCTFLAYLNELGSNEKKLSVAAEDAMVGRVIFYNASSGWIQGGGFGGSSPLPPINNIHNIHMGVVIDMQF